MVIRPFYALLMAAEDDRPKQTVALTKGLEDISSYFAKEVRNIDLFHPLLPCTFFRFLDCTTNLNTYFSDGQEVTPYFNECGFSLFEAAVLPWVQRLDVVLGPYREFSMPTSPAGRRLQSWYAACLNVPSFAKTVVSPERLRESYSGYASGTATSTVANLNRAGGV